MFTFTDGKMFLLTIIRKRVQPVTKSSDARGSVNAHMSLDKMRFEGTNTIGCYRAIGTMHARVVELPHGVPIRR